MVVRGPRDPGAVDGDGGSVAVRTEGTTSRGPPALARSDADEGRTAIWYEIADDHSVLELRAAVTSGHSLALHVVIDTDADMTIAWWETQNGMWVIEVGAA
jgi:hypothetical protein